MIIRKFIIQIVSKFDSSGFREADKSAKALEESIKKATRELKGLKDAADEAGDRTRKLQENIKRLRDRLDKLNSRSLKNVVASFQGASDKLGKFRQAMEPVTAVASAASRAILAIGAAGTATAVGVIRTGVSFESLRARLKTTEGSAERAAVAFNQIKEFTRTTPFQLEEVTTAFVRLRSLGLDASKESLTAFGNLASAQGKSIIDFIEAVADASTGEFERLKEFGIKASSEGDRVSFTFKGQTTTVGKNAAEIQAFLRNLGETEFAGAMEDQMATAAGAISNLKDTFFTFLDTVAQMGVLEEFKGLLGDLATAAGGQGFAGIIAEALVTALRALRDALAKITEEDVRGFLNSAVNAAKAFASAIELAAKALSAFSDASGDTEAALGNMALALTGLIALFAGPAGLAVAAGAAGAVIGRMLANLILDLDGTNDRLRELEANIAATSANIAQIERQIAASESRIVRREQAREKFQMELEARGNKQAQALVGGLGAGLVQNVSEEERRFRARQIRRGSAAEAAQGRAALLTAEGQRVLEAVDKAAEAQVKRAESAARREAQRAGGDEAAVEAAVSSARLAAQRDAFSRREKAFKSATETFAATGSAKAAAKAAVAAATPKAAKKKGGKGRAADTFFDFEKRAGAAAKTQAETFAEQELQRLISEGVESQEAIQRAQEAGKKRASELKQRFLEAGRIFDASADNILDIIGLRGPGSVLEGRPPPQTLLITISPVIKFIETFNQTIESVAGAKNLAEVTGQGGQMAVEDGLEPHRKTFAQLFQDQFKLATGRLLKAGGGGALPPGPEG